MLITRKVCRYYEIKSRNYEILKSRYYEKKNCNYEIISRNNVILCYNKGNSYSIWHYCKCVWGWNMLQCTLILVYPMQKYLHFWLLLFTVRVDLSPTAHGYIYKFTSRPTSNIKCACMVLSWRSVLLSLVTLQQILSRKWATHSAYSWGNVQNFYQTMYLPYCAISPNLFWVFAHFIK